MCRSAEQRSFSPLRRDARQDDPFRAPQPSAVSQAGHLFGEPSASETPRSMAPDAFGGRAQRAVVDGFCDETRNPRDVGPSAPVRKNAQCRRSRADAEESRCRHFQGRRACDRSAAKSIAGVDGSALAGQASAGRVPSGQCIDVQPAARGTLGPRRMRSSALAEDLGLFGRELLIGERAAFVQVSELRELVDRVSGWTTRCSSREPHTGAGILRRHLL